MGWQSSAWLQIPDYGDRVSTLEGATYEFTFWREISSGTSGTLTKPTGSTILLDRWPGDVDSVVSVVATGKVPDEEYAYTSAGAVVTSTLTTAGAWTLSAAPSSYPVAIIGRASVPLSALKAMVDGGEILLDYEKVDPTTEIGYLFIPAGAMVPATTTPAEFGTNEYNSPGMDLDYFAFDSGTAEFITFPAVLKYWDGGTVTPTFFWSSPAASTIGDIVEFSIRGVAIGDSDVLAATYGANRYGSDELTASDGADLQIFGTDVVTIGGSGSGGELINFEVARYVAGASDDMAEDAWLFGVLIAYTKSVVQD